MAENRTILIIDDEDDMCEGLRSIFEDEGFQVETVGSGIEAMEVLGQRAFKIILVDLIMEGIDGAETIGKIKELGIDSKIFVMTATQEQKLIDDAIRAGAIFIFKKPFDMEEMLTILNESLAY